MTVRRKRPDGQEELVKVPFLRMLLGQEGFRLVLIGLLLSMHPLGRSFLSGFGFKFQDEKKIEEASVAAKGNQDELLQLVEAVKEVKTDLASLKANSAIVNAKVDSMEQTFRGFQVDFNKWKPRSSIEQ